MYIRSAIRVGRLVRATCATTAVVILCASMSGCKNNQSATAGSKDSDSDSTSACTIVTTTGMVGDIVKNVAGEHGTVTNLIGEGVDPHLYRATRSDVIKLQRADMIFYNGLMLEGKMSDTLVKMASKRPVIAVTERIEQDFLLEPEDAPGHHDPHVWMDVQAWIQAVLVVRDALVDFAPSHAEDFTNNAANYTAWLKELDEYVTKILATIPEQQRVLVTAHDAFNYFGRRYGLTVRGIQGLSTESEAGLQDISNLIGYIMDNKVPAIFVETSVADKNVRALIEGVQARGGSLSIGGTLFSDAMGEPGTYEGTYIGMLDHNATTVARALGGEAPVGGMNGKLSQESP